MHKDYAEVNLRMTNDRRIVEETILIEFIEKNQHHAQLAQAVLSSKINKNKITDASNTDTSQPVIFYF